MRTRLPLPAVSPMLMMMLAVLCLGQAAAFTVCVVSSPGFGVGLANPTCNARNTLLDDPGQTSFMGIEVELFRSVASRAGWYYDPSPAGLAAPLASKRFALRCISQAAWDVLASSSCNATMCNTTNVCHVMFGGQSQSTERLANVRYKVSQPLLSTAFAIVVYDDAQQPVDLMAFLKPLDWKLWVVFIVTIITLPFIIWTVEKLATEGYIPLNKSSGVDLRFAVYRNILTVFNQDIMFVSTTGAQLTMITFLLLTFVAVSTYTASLASFLTLTTSSTTANDLRDFAGKPIFVLSSATSFVQQTYGITNFSTNAVLTSAAMIGALTADVFLGLKNHTLAAAFIPRYLIEGTRAQVNDCKYRIVGRDVENVLMSFFFHSAMPDAMTDAIDSAILSASDQGLVGSLVETMTSASSCTTEDAADPITYAQMFGLFLILYGALGGGLIYTLFVFIKNRVNGKVADSFGKEETADPAATPLEVKAVHNNAPGPDDEHLVAYNDYHGLSKQAGPRPPTSAKGNPRPNSAQSSLKVPLPSP